nr:MAG TPA: hypothetical protein [Caudoviricetes sp.]
MPIFSQSVGEPLLYIVSVISCNFSLGVFAISLCFALIIIVMS